MRILFVTHATILGGANRSMLKLIQELKCRYGATCFVVMPLRNNSGPLEEKLCELGVVYYRQHYYWFKGRRNSGLKPRIKYLITRLMYHYLASKLSTANFDIVHSNGSVIDYGSYIARYYHKPHVWHLREFGDVDFGLLPLFGDKHEKKVYCFGNNYFLAISNAIKEHFANKISGRPCAVIYNGLEPVDEELHSTHENSVMQFCVLGVINEAKNQLEIIKAIDYIVNQKNISNFKVSFYGKKDPLYMDSIISFIKDCRIDGYVTFVDEVDGVSKILKTMDVGIVSSRSEAFGRVTIEYMMQKIVVIASDTGANPELINNGKTGLLYHIGSVKELGDQMIYLMENRNELVRIANNSFEYAMKHFTASRNADEIYSTYLRCCNV